MAVVSGRQWLQTLSDNFWPTCVWQYSAAAAATYFCPTTVTPRGLGQFRQFSGAIAHPVLTAVSAVAAFSWTTRVCITHSSPCCAAPCTPVRFAVLLFTVSRLIHFPWPDAAYTGRSLQSRGHHGRIVSSPRAILGSLPWAMRGTQTTRKQPFSRLCHRVCTFRMHHCPHHDGTNSGLFLGHRFGSHSALAAPPVSFAVFANCPQLVRLRTPLFLLASSGIFRLCMCHFSPCRAFRNCCLSF